MHLPPVSMAAQRLSGRLCLLLCYTLLAAGSARADGGQGGRPPPPPPPVNAWLAVGADVLEPESRAGEAGEGKGQRGSGGEGTGKGRAKKRQTGDGKEKEKKRKEKRKKEKRDHGEQNGGKGNVESPERSAGVASRDGRAMRVGHEQPQAEDKTEQRRKKEKRRGSVSTSSLLHALPLPAVSSPLPIAPAIANLEDTRDTSTRQSHLGEREKERGRSELRNVSPLRCRFLFGFGCCPHCRRCFCCASHSPPS